MYQSVAVRRVQSRRNFDRDAKRLIERERASLQSCRHGLAFQVLHHKKIHSVVATDVVDLDDVRMLECRKGPSLAIEAFLELRVAGKMRGKNFNGYVSAKGLS